MLKGRRINSDGLTLLLWVYIGSSTRHRIEGTHVRQGRHLESGASPQRWYLLHCSTFLWGPGHRVGTASVYETNEERGPKKGIFDPIDSLDCAWLLHIAGSMPSWPPLIAHIGLHGGIP
ncbi:hypothetical protein F5146DRAFT_1070298 [Armillaria mellea]|nr:hypothetical protein F5146DRAFT_1070298 [Armillaria mellea]